MCDHKYMQKLKKAEIILQEPTFFRFSSALNVLIYEGLLQGQIVQYSPGEGIDQVMGFKSDRVGLVHTRFPHKACIRTGQPQGCVTFTLPVIDASDWKLNGASGGQRTLFLNFGWDETELFAPRRNLFAGSVETEFLLGVMVAVGGYEPDEAEIPKGPISLEPDAFATLLSAFADAVYGSETFDDQEAVEQSVAAALATALIGERTTHAPQVCRSYETFRTAQQYLTRSQNATVHLDDLCGLCGVSAPTLTAAFYQVTGLSPARYNRHLHLSRAYKELSSLNVEKLTVKLAARRAGFSQLGRFSGYYKQVYGELPSQTQAR